MSAAAPELDTIVDHLKNAQRLAEVRAATGRMFMKALCEAIEAEEREADGAPTQGTPAAAAVAALVRNRLAGGSLAAEDEAVVAWVEKWRVL